MANNLLKKDPQPQQGSSDKDKKMKKLKKSLQAIEKLKLKKANGEQLEINQLQKIDTEEQLKKELEMLALA